MPSKSLAEIEDAIAALAPRGFMCGYHMRYSRPVRRVMTYPSDWIQAYTRLNLIIADPTAIWGIRTEGSIRWSELAATAPDPLNVFGLARQHGLTFGVTLAHGPVESRSIFGAANGQREFTDTEIARMCRLLRQGHDMLARSTAIRPILVSALDAMACGMTYDQACAHLGISRTALRYRLQAARKALGAEDNPQAIRKAIDTGLLPYHAYSGMPKGLPTGPDDKI